MPATTVEKWLQADRADGPPHRCRKILREWATDDGSFVTCRADDGSQQTHKLIAMSSLSGRACFKCGNVGHFAEVCSSAERLCYNCKQPGRGPTSLHDVHSNISQATSRTAARCHEPPKPSNATIVKVLVTCRVTALPSALAALAPADAAIPVVKLAI